MTKVSKEELIRQMREFQRMKKQKAQKEHHDQAQNQPGEEAADKDELNDLMGEIAKNIYDSAVLLGRVSQLVNHGDGGESQEEETASEVNEPSDEDPVPPQIRGQLAGKDPCVMLITPDSVCRVLSVNTVKKEEPWLFEEMLPMHPIPGAKDLYFRFADRSCRKTGKRCFVLNEVLVCRIDEEAGEYVTPGLTDILAAIAFFGGLRAVRRSRNGGTSYVFNLDLRRQ